MQCESHVITWESRTEAAQQHCMRQAPAVAERHGWPPQPPHPFQPIPTPPPQTCHQNRLRAPAGLLQGAVQGECRVSVRCLHSICGGSAGFLVNAGGFRVNARRDRVIGCMQGLGLCQVSAGSVPGDCLGECRVSACRLPGARRVQGDWGHARSRSMPGECRVSAWRLPR